jgi:CMP-N-acetylneuraminic acid synthetase
MRVLGLIPARGGSKGILRKNIRLLCNRPLLEYTACAALNATTLSRVVLSTEDDEIANVGRQCGLEVPFLRPIELARDDTPTLPVVQHALQWLEAQSDRFDAMCLLEPTSPFRTAADIDACVKLFDETGADTVVSVIPVPDKYHPHRVLFKDEHDCLHSCLGNLKPILRRQDRPVAFCRDGSVYVTRREVIMEQHTLYGKVIRGFPIDPSRTMNIDSPSDWEIAETLVSRSEWPANL